MDYSLELLSGDADRKNLQDCFRPAIQPEKSDVRYDSFCDSEVNPTLGKTGIAQMMHHYIET